MYSIKPLSEADRAAWLDIQLEAFPTWFPGPEEKADYLKTYNPESAQQTCLGCYLEDRLVGTIQLIDFTMKVLSVKLPVIGVSNVATDILHRKEHVGKETMAVGLKHIRDRGIHLSTLFAFRPDFYRKMGVGYGAKLEKYWIKPASLPRGENKTHIGRLTPEDRAAFVACYQRDFDTTHGLFEKSDTDVDRVFCGDMYNTTIGYKKEGRIEGYVTYYLNRKDNFQAQLLIREFIYNTPEALSNF
jgi:predicted acetyltransferase